MTVVDDGGVVVVMRTFGLIIGRIITCLVVGGSAFMVNARSVVSDRLGTVFTVVY